MARLSDVEGGVVETWAGGDRLCICCGQEAATGGVWIVDDRCAIICSECARTGAAGLATALVDALADSPFPFTLGLLNQSLGAFCRAATEAWRRETKREAA